MKSATSPANLDSYSRRQSLRWLGSVAALGALGVAGRIKSPTYAVVEPHETPTGLAVSHFDFYRFNDPREWEDAGFRDLFAAPGLKLAEWPDKAVGLLPVADWVMRIDALDSGARHIQVHAPTALGACLLQNMPT